ncbi:DUF1573 domain-containing protein [Pelagicoccus sp. SDUM812003]|uniref:DUF1573 domain-containing protein n=1 Tax=Pelagicoccus sp. SDUM812003 TaxID=3041267 RepID=UPI00280E0911|nr:DUF1573 domain-containing protein [Pelagicoccus sp. SDUM812003]MDQ8202325.1 DUF1573 domain-containing protein [Pelagicoccus sp. SDUM812003]
MNTTRPFSFIFLMLRLASISAATAVGLQAAAQSLEWDNTKQSFETEFGQEEVKATYAFTNTGSAPVEIAQTKSTCGCTVPSLDKKVYQPGESGELTAIFTVGSRQGPQHKMISVRTLEAGEEQSYELVLEVDIPIPVALKPRVRFWKAGSEPKPQEVLISFHEKIPMSIDGVKRMDPAAEKQFDYAFETIEEGQQYRMTITPLTADTKTREVFYLVSDDDETDLLAKYPIYLYVR